MIRLTFIFFLSSGFVWGQQHPPVQRGIEQTTQPVALNQVGYETMGPKRLTAFGAKDGTTFIIRSLDDTANVYQGKIQRGIGDFSEFQPADSQQEYVIALEEESETSFPFRIHANLYQEQFWRPALDFMIDVRSVVGTHPSAFGGSPWRDGTYYSYEVPSLLWLYAADPQFFEQLPRQISWKADKQRVLSPDFVFDANNPQSEGVMEAVVRYYSELEAPAEDTPDIIQLVHWGLGFYLMKPYTKDPSQDPLPKQIHSQVVEQFSHLLYAWDSLELHRWLPQSFYDRCYTFAQTHWQAVGSLDVDSLWHPRWYDEPVRENGTWKLDYTRLLPYKGRHVPGHSILPNLFMYQVVKQSQPSLSGAYLQAAQQQTQWIIDSLDWSLPATTKGHRGSEFQTLVNLSWFLQHMPEQAPSELREKIAEWAKVAIARSDNPWDFRRYDLSDHWTIPDLNETGNVAGFPAAALSAARMVQDSAMQQRLVELAYAHVDNLFGRNPQLAAATHRPAQGYPLVEQGWPLGYKKDVCARLELCRGGIDASPGTEMYPFNPDGEYRHPEGWVNWNASWNVGLAFLKMNQTPLH